MVSEVLAIEVVTDTQRPLRIPHVLGTAWSVFEVWTVLMTKMPGAYDRWEQDSLRRYSVGAVCQTCGESIAEDIGELSSVLGQRRTR